MAGFRGTGHIPLKSGFYWGIFMSRAILDDSPAFWRYLGKSDFLAHFGPKCPQNGHFWPKIAIFFELAEVRGTGHIPPISRMYCGIFMSQAIFDDSPAFWRYLGKSDFLTHLDHFLWSLKVLGSEMDTNARIARIARGFAKNGKQTKVAQLHYLSNKKRMRS